MSVSYLDASAWIKRYVQETGTERVQRWFDTGPLLACASLGLVEVLATLARKQQAGELSPAAFQQKSQEAQNDFEAFFRIHFTEAVLKTARPLPARYALRGADTVHLASALFLREELTDEDDIDQVTVVTSDVALRQAAQMAGFPTYDPNENAALPTGGAL